MNIYVGNLSLEATEEELRKAFEAFGQVALVNVIKARYILNSARDCSYLYGESVTAL